MIHSISWWWARLGRLRGGGPAVGGSRDLGRAARCRRQERQLGGDDAVRAGPDGRRQGQQLGVRHRAAEGPQRPHRLSAARQGARRLVRDQRHGLYPRPSLGLRPLGLARQCRLVAMPTCCPTSSARKTIPISTANITARAARSHVNKLRTDNPVQQTFLQAAREAQFRIREDFNAEDHEGLGIYQVTQKNGERWSAARGLYPSAYGQPRQSARRNRCARATRILFEGKRAVGVEYVQGKETKTDPRAARGDPVLRRVPVAAAADAVRRRRRRGTGKARHRERASSARRRPEPAGPSGFHLRLHVRQPEFRRHSRSSGIAAAVPRHRAIPARAARADDLEFRRMRRLPEDAARPRRARHPAAFRHGDGRRSRPQAPSRHRLLLPRLPAAAEEPRQRLRSAAPIRSPRR